MDFLFSTISGPALESSQSPAQWVPWILSSLVKRLGHEAELSAVSKAQVKSGGGDFSVYLIQSQYGPGVDSASNRNEDQESSWGLKGGRR
jgi:hypothetical protein